MNQFLSIYTQVLTEKYAVFSGRANRQEYWTFTLIGFTISLILMVLDQVLGLTVGVSVANPEGFGLLGLVFALATLLPSIAVLVRRLHDTNRSGWWSLILLIPLLGVVAILIFTLSKGEPGANRFGPAPNSLS